MKKLRLTTSFAVGWMLVTYLVSGAVRTVCYTVLAKFGVSSLYILATNVVIYAPLFCMLFVDSRLRRKAIRFFVLYLGIALFFLITLAIHPNYLECYTRDIFGAIDAVFRPDTGALFGFLAVYLCKDFKQLRKFLLYAAYLTLLYSLYQLLMARRMGYWESYSYTGDTEHLNYNMDFGYSMIFCCIVFFDSFLSNRKHWYDLILTVLCFVLVLTEGSRGPMVCFVAYIVLYCLLRIKNMSLPKKLLIVALMIAAYVILANTWTDILSWIIKLLSGMNINSRTIDMLLNDTLMSDNGRNRIAELAWGVIDQQGFFGNGAYGSRWAIAPSYYWGYPHNIFLEFIIDYGWMLGCILLGALVFAILRTLFNADDETLCVLCVLLSMNAKLLLSDSYWAYQFFWALLGCMALVGSGVGRRFIKRKRSVLQRIVR